MSHVSKGASFIIGSGPRGIGKKTTMRALPGFAPGRLPFVIALPEEISGISNVPSCVISHEVHSQIVAANDVPEDQFRAINPFVFIVDRRR